MEQFLKDFEPVKDTVWQDDKKLKSDTAEILWNPHHGNAEKVILAKPKTYMNNSGMAVSLLAEYYKIQPTDIWILHDDVDLQLGALRIRNGGSAGGHHGVESIIQSLKTEKFWRFRLGIGRPHHNIDRDRKGYIKGVEEYVLEPFKGPERKKIKDLVYHASAAMQKALEDSLDAAMNQYNTK